MVSKVDSIQIDNLDIQNKNEMAMRQFYHELTQSFAKVKSTIQECIQSLESNIQIKPCLIYSMKNAMQDIECVRESFDTMKRHIGINSQIEYERVLNRNNDY